ncbi:hypothetical protein [Hydrogenophaga sp. BPS33]|uniref:hypothetical protein n=1 Tax=Hydrogenophaga sp. BPS33 TaxID=2651974 RepID=UPI00131F8849|nr:hypothetical protein [Hydrogenophaga sp. BPS33]QHE86116.1 hypothetical protein F9K07_14990 [Hydrogenophaga sp. BPS33]
MNPPPRRREWLPSLPVLQWGRAYNRETLLGDGVAALIVAIMQYQAIRELSPEAVAHSSTATQQQD